MSLLFQVVVVVCVCVMGALGQASDNSNCYSCATCTLNPVLMPGATSVCDHCFAYCAGSLQSISIPDSVISIDSYALQGLGCASVTLPNSLQSISNGAFAGAQLSSIVFPETSLLYIGNGAFGWMPLLTTVEIPATVVTIDNFGFYNAPLTSLTFAPNSQLTTLGANSFCGNSNQPTVYIPITVTSPPDIETIKSTVFCGQNPNVFYASPPTVEPTAAPTATPTAAPTTAAPTAAHTKKHHHHHPTQHPTKKHRHHTNNLRQQEDETTI